MQGNGEDADALLREVLPKLHAIAVRELKAERYMAPLSKTELIHELWLGSLSKGGWRVDSREHFYALASLAMRHVLVDLARKRLAARRGGTQFVVSLDGPEARKRAAWTDDERVVEIGILMERLEVKHPDAARIVDMHYFSGFTFEEVAAETGLTLKQVQYRWKKGHRWLKKTMRSVKDRDGGAPGHALMSPGLV
jgi:RNA polymerase sigma factor (TIGR02999 family)